MHDASCCLCGGGTFKKIFDARNDHYGIPGLYTVARCRGCGLVMLNPRPSREELLKLYSEDYEPHQLDMQDADRMLDAQQARRRLVEKYARRGCILDAGSGDGWFLLSMKRAGWDAHGCEPSPRAAAFQRDALGLDTVTGGVFTAQYPGESFDAVTMWSVLEHVEDPAAMLRELSRIMKPGGTLIAGVPNFNSVERSLFGPKWFSLMVPFHLYHFTPRTMKSLLEKTGFKLEQTIFSTTATSALASARLLLRKSQPAPHAPSQKDQDIQESAKSGSPLKKAVFAAAIVPGLRLLDTLRLGAHTIYIARK